jgi:hypothetical protein
MWTGPDGTPVADAIAGITDALEALFTWNAEDGVFLSFRPDGPIFLNTAEFLNYGDGLWVNITSPTVWSQPASGLGAAIQ